MKIELNKKKILEYQNNEPPYLMIDHASEVITGKSAVGYKYLNKDEWFFKVHWKNDPNMPGMLQIEALSQMAALSILTLPGNTSTFSNIGIGGIVDEVTTTLSTDYKQITVKIGIPGSTESTQLNAIKTAKANQGYTLTFSPYGL